MCGLIKKKKEKKKKTEKLVVIIDRCRRKFCSMVGEKKGASFYLGAHVCSNGSCVVEDRVSWRLVRFFIFSFFFRASLVVVVFQLIYLLGYLVRGKNRKQTCNNRATTEVVSHGNIAATTAINDY